MIIPQWESLRWVYKSIEKWVDDHPLLLVYVYMYICYIYIIYICNPTLHHGTSDAHQTRNMTFCRGTPGSPSSRKGTLRLHAILSVLRLPWCGRKRHGGFDIIHL